ncbi:MAG TPA: Na+/H+ antiporter subunit E [Parvibaculum sp.]
MAKAIALGIALFVFWLVLSGHYTAFLLAIGIFSSALCVALAARMHLIDAETIPTQLRLSLPVYWLWLAGEIVKANIAVGRIILSPRMALGQRFIFVPTSQRTEMGRVIFANSITLTPGTVTLETAKNALLVHALSAPFASFDEMDRRASAAEGH